MSDTSEGGEGGADNLSGSPEDHHELASEEGRQRKRPRRATGGTKVLHVFQMLERVKLIWPLISF